MPGLTVLSGASRGLGEAMLHRLVEIGEQVVVIGRSLPDSLGREPQGQVSWIECDLAEAGRWTDDAGVLRTLRDRLDARTVARLTFINNAGVVRPIGKVGVLPVEELLASIAVNFSAPAVIANACLAWAAARGIPSRVINISSGAAQRPIAGWSAYCGTKAGARMFFDALSSEGTSDVSHVDPGVMDTAMQDDIRSADQDRFPDVERFRGLLSDGKLADPAVVARSIVDGHYAAAIRSAP